MRLEGKVALVTGGAMGIGGATAVLFAREGAKVMVGDINEEASRKMVEDIRRLGGQAQAVHLDVRQSEEWARAVEKTLAWNGRLDILVNNAGSGTAKPLMETTDEIWDRTVTGYMTSCFLGMKHVIPVMQRQGGGAIVNVSSILGLMGSYSQAAYCAAKGGVRVLTKAAAVQHAKDNIRVNSVYPGWTFTPGTSAGFSRPELAQPRLARCPMGRFGKPEEIACGILFLASDEASFCTGTELVIDGGTTSC